MGIKQSSIFRTYRGLPRNIYVLFIARIINGIGNFVYPFLTLFLTEKLGYTTGEAGRFIFIAAIIAGAGSLAGGKICDICSRKKVAILVQLCMAMAYIPCAFLGKSILVPCFLVLMGFFTGASLTVNNTMAADLTDKENRKVVFSLLYLGNNIGFAIGPAIAGVLYHKYLGWLFLGNSVLILIAITLIYLYVDESSLIKEGASCEVRFDDEKAEKGTMLDVLIKRPQLIFFCFIAMVYSFVYGQHPFMIPIQVTKVFGDNGPAIFGTLMSINGLVVVTMTTFMTHLTHKYRTVTNMVLAGVFYTIGFGMLIFVKSYGFFVLSSITWTFGEILSATNLSVYIVNNTPVSHRGRFNSLTLLITGVGFAIGPVVMGKFIERYNIRCAWVIILFLAFSATIMMYILRFLEKRKEKKMLKKNESIDKVLKIYNKKEMVFYKEE